MMESSAVFFGLLFVWAMARLRSQPRAWVGLVAIVAAVLSAAIKVTSFFGFAAFVALAFLWLVLREHGWRPQWLRQHWRLLFWGSLSALAVLATLTLWQHADALKAQSALGRQITSDALSTWNYGTLQQRLDPATWWGTVFKKRFSGAIGSNWIFLIFVIAGLWQKRTRAAVGILLLAYLAPFLVFTNLHIAHPYYQAANIVFATSIIGLVLWSTVLAAEAAGAAPRRRAGDCPVRAVGGLRPGEVAEGHQGSARADSGFADCRGHPYRHDGAGRGGRVRAGLVLRTAVLLWPPRGDDSRLGVGRGARVAGRRRRRAGRLPLAALVNCPSQVGSSPERMQWQAEIIRRYAAGGQKQEIGGCEVWLHR